MKLTVRHLHLRSTDELDSLIEERILALQPRLQVDEADVRLECRHDASPAFSVNIHLVTPGPDVFAEGHDHTIRAAIDKVMADLEATVSDRVEKRRARMRGCRQQPVRMRRGQARC